MTLHLELLCPAYELPGTGYIDKLERAQQTVTEMVTRPELTWYKESRGTWICSPWRRLKAGTLLLSTTPQWEVIKIESGS